MAGPDQAALLEALRRQLERLPLPEANIGFRHRAWREFERSLDPLGTARQRPAHLPRERDSAR
jgi:hypothetical protein